MAEIKKSGNVGSEDWGGTRKGAGRPPLNPMEKPEIAHPMKWLWQELTQLLPAETVNDLRTRFNAENQRYQKARIAQKRLEREIEKKKALKDIEEQIARDGAIII